MVQHRGLPVEFSSANRTGNWSQTGLKALLSPAHSNSWQSGCSRGKHLLFKAQSLYAEEDIGAHNRVGTGRWTHPHTVRPRGSPALNVSHVLEASAPGSQGGCSCWPHKATVRTQENTQPDPRTQCCLRRPLPAPHGKPSPTSGPQPRLSLLRQSFCPDILWLLCPQLPAKLHFLIQRELWAPGPALAVWAFGEK